MDAIFSKIRASIIINVNGQEKQKRCCKEQKHPFSNFKMIVLTGPCAENTEQTGGALAWL